MTSLWLLSKKILFCFNYTFQCCQLLFWLLSRTVMFSSTVLTVEHDFMIFKFYWEMYFMLQMFWFFWLVVIDKSPFSACPTNSHIHTLLLYIFLMKYWQLLNNNLININFYNVTEFTCSNIFADSWTDVTRDEIKEQRYEI